MQHGGTKSISIHALREEGDLYRIAQIQHQLISIHALREEGDHFLIDQIPSTLYISIHALREEGDAAVR